MTEASEAVRRWERVHPEQAAAMRSRRRQVKKERNRAIVEEARSKPCADCGIQYPIEAMQLDHVTGEKLNHVAKAIGQTWSLKKLYAEIAKCVVRCANCHAIKSTRESRERAHRPGTSNGGSDHGDERD